MATVRRLVASFTLGLLGTGGLGLPACAQEEVPFVTTPDRVTLAMLKIGGVGPADRLIDLGSGDGRIVITAARRFGARGLGVEIVPDLVKRSRDAAARAGVADRTEFREQDLFKTDLSGATVITMYLLPEVNLQLRPSLLALAPGTRVVSHDWDMGDWLPDRSLTLDVPEKAIGREKISRIHLWRVPAPVDGLWCGTEGVALLLQQRFQQVQGQARAGGQARGLSGRLDGARLELLAADGRLRLRWTGDASASAQRAVPASGVDGLAATAATAARAASPGTGLARLRVEHATGRLGPWLGQSLRRAADGATACSGEALIHRP